MIEPDSRPRRRERMLNQRAEETLILLDPDDGQYFALNDVGARLWELCDGQLSVAEIVRQLSAEYDAPSAVIEADALELIDELEREKLLIPVR